MILFLFKQKTAYEMRISDWSSDVCSSDLSDATLDKVSGTGSRRQAVAFAPPPAPFSAMVVPQGQWQPANTENYAAHEDNPVHRTSEQPVSTFSIDVDTGSYANVRRMLPDGVRPPAAAVRAEARITYFRYRSEEHTS